MHQSNPTPQSMASSSKPDPNPANASNPAYLNYLDYCQRIGYANPPDEATWRKKSSSHWTWGK